MKKRFLLFTMALAFSILPSSAFAEEPIKVDIGGEKINFSVDPILESGRTLVEFRPVFEKLGFVVQWDEKNQSVEGKRKSDGLRLEFQIGKYAASAGYHPLHTLPLDIPAKIINGHTLVPLRFVAEVSGKKVDWNDHDRTIKIDSKSGHSSLVSMPSIQMAVLKTPIASSQYVVKKGDSLYRIAMTNQISLSTLMQVNDLSTDQIYVGQTLVLPSNSSTPDLIHRAVSSPSPSASSFTPTDITASFASHPAVNPKPNRKPLYPSDFAFTANDPLQALIRPLLGVPYEYGGNTPSGFDCSGLTKYVFREMGVTLPRVSSDQFTQGQAVDPTQMQEGDLIFYDTAGSGKVSHVAIYLGNGYLAHASEKSVVIDTLHHLRKYPLIGVKRFSLSLPSAPVPASVLPNI